jgi:Icc-related predicted phosphoesterase
MKIQIISDLHQEFGQTNLTFNNADVVVFAGDINIGIKGIEWLIEKIKDKPVLYILGNHEYYKGSYPKTLNKIKALAELTNIKVLENEAVEIENVVFHGATLWTDFSLFGNPQYYGMLCQEKMNDYQKIRKDPSFSKLRSIDTFRIHSQSVIWLTESLLENKGKTNIVITHHAPSLKSIPQTYKEDPISSAYASNLEDLILKFQPKLWIHGHIHEPINYSIGQTKVICNPHGYINEKYNGYNKELILEISS